MRAHPACEIALGLGLVLVGGCGGPQPPRLVALPGCGIGDGLIDNLRVKARGDFPDGSGTEVRLSDGEETLAWGDRLVAGVTVEGLFGQTLVEAVGRTARLRTEGDIPVYFARVDGVCPVEPAEGVVAPREGVAADVAAAGDVIIVGGRDAEGTILGEVLHLSDEGGALTPLPERLAVPVVGHSVHALADRRFLVFGGASGNRAVQRKAVIIDLADEAQPVFESIPVELDEQLGPGRTFHVGARDGSGRVLLVGGCRRITSELTCDLEMPEPGPDPSADPHTLLPSVLDTSLWVEPAGETLALTPGPSLVTSRYEAALRFARDGVAFLAGGRDDQGQPVHTVERYLPGEAGFSPYGGEPIEGIEDLPVVGVALHEGGVVLLALADGRILLVTDQTSEGTSGTFEPWAGWCDEGARCVDEPIVAASAHGWSLVTLPGERVLANGTLLPVGGVGLRGADARALSDQGDGAVSRRVGAVPLTLADGTVLLVGGRDARSDQLASPTTVRVRPALDGPDEGIPSIDSLEPGSLMSPTLAQVTLTEDSVQLMPRGSPTDNFPWVRVHARGFRSARFRFEVTVSWGSVGRSTPYLVLQHGAVETISVALGTDGIEAHTRDPRGQVANFSCSPMGLSFEQPVALRVDVSPDSIRLERGGEIIAQCPGFTGGRLWSVGLGAAGPGSVLLSDMRLTRR
ncbi:MAG: hypothetical protein AAGF11_39675 [Myxococcota bacterium]